ncbi:uncharacterized protein LOC135564488 [Oncorhynchus nerka]|uniref:uncharacterized protein LOC135564488 n=1 Tax=Oncorhynchus nerka TaxID=8023 RepID=UPI0031B89F19
MSLEDIEQQDYDVSDTETVRALSQSLDLPVCVVDDHLTSEAVNEMKQSSTVETTEEESLNSAKNLESFSLIINFLQNLTEEQWSRIRNGISDPLTKQQLAGLCLRIVQFLSDKLMQIIIPGLYELLGIQDAASPLSQRSLTSSLTSLLDDKVNTKSRVRFTEAGVPKRPGSRKSYNSFRIPTPYPSSNCMDQEEEEEQESQQLKFKEIYLTKEMGSLGSGSYCPKPLPKPAMRTSLSDVQKKTTNSDSLQVLLGVSEDTLVTCVQDSLQGSLSKLACMSNSPSGSAGSPKMTPAVMAEVIKDVKSAVSVVVKSASASQTSQVTPVRGDSQTKVTESMVRELAAKLEKVDQESKSLTGQVMAMISDTMVAFVDENEQNLLKDPKDKITFLASHVGFIDDLDALLDCIRKLSSEEFKRDTTQAVSEFLVKRSNSSLTSAQPAYSVASRSCSVQNQRTLSKDICADSPAFGIIDTFVEDLQSLAQPAEVEEREPDLQENAQKRKSRIWSATTSLYKNIKKTLKGFTIHRRRSDVQRRMSSHTPTEDSGHLVTKEYLGLASQNLTQASKSVPHLPSLNQEVTLHTGVSESSKLLWTETDEGLMNNSTKQVISTILTSCEDQTSNAPCFSTVGKKISDMSLEVNILVGGVLSQLKDISLSRSPTPCEDMFERLQGSTERTSPVSLDCSTAASKGIASSHSLSTKSLQKLSSHEFQTKAEKGVSEVLSRSFNIVEEGTTDKYLQSVSTSTTSTDIIQTIVKDLQELTQTTQSSDMVSGTSLLTTGQVSEKRIWSVARNIYYSLQSKITEFLRKDLQMSDTTLGSIQIFTYQISPASQRASLCHLEVNQSSVTPGGNDACVDIPHKLLPKTTKLSGSMLEDIGTIRCRSADSQNTRNTSSSRSSISLTPTSKSKQSEWDFTLPGTPIPTELSAQIDFPIVRNMIIQDLFHTENLLPPSFVDKVRQAAGVVVDEMVESVENTQEDGQGASHPDDLRSAVRKLRKIISTGTIHIFSHEFVDKVIALQDSHSTPQVLTLAAARSASDSILSRLKWGKEQCAISRKLSSQLLQIFAEETVKGFLKQWLDEYENINIDVSVQNEPSTSTCMVFPIQLNQSKPEDSDTMNQLTKVMVNKMMDALSVGSSHQMITKANAKCSFESGTSMATSDIVEGMLDLVRDSTSSTGEQIPIFKSKKSKKTMFSKICFNIKGSKKVRKDHCPQKSMEYQPQNTSPTVYFTESRTNSHGSFAPEGNDIAYSFPPEEKSRKPSLFTRMYRAITRSFSNPR